MEIRFENSDLLNYYTRNYKEKQKFGISILLDFGQN